MAELDATRTALADLVADETMTAAQRLAIAQSLWNNLKTGEKLTVKEAETVNREASTSISGFKRKAAEDAIKDAQTVAAEEINAITRATNEKIKSVEDLKKLDQISTSEELARLQGLEESRYLSVENELIQEYIAAQGNKDAQERIWKEMEADFQAHNDRMADITRTTTDQMVSDYEKSWAPVTNSFNSMVSSMMSGNTTLMNALRQGLVSFITEAVQDDLKRAEHYILSEAAMTDANLAGNSIRAAADQQSSGTGIAQQAENAIKAIGIDGAKVFGDVYAYLSPEMGPFAAIPAGLAFAAVVAKEALIPSFDVGTMGVPSNMLAQVHAGEMIVPSFDSGLFRSALANMSGGGAGGQGGGDTYNIAVNVATSGNYTEADGRRIANLMSQQIRNNNSNLRRSMSDT